MFRTAGKSILLKEFKANIYQHLLERGLAATDVHLVEEADKAEYMVIDFKQDEWQEVDCNSCKIFCLNATKKKLEKFMDEKAPRQVMAFVDFTSGLEFIYFWFTKLLTQPEQKELVMEEFFPLQWGRGSSYLGLVNSLPTWSIALLPVDIPVVLTSVVPYTAADVFEVNFKVLKSSLNIVQKFKVIAPQLRPMQRIFWLEGIRVK